MRRAIAKVISAALPKIVTEDSFVVNYIEKERVASMYTCISVIKKLGNRRCHDTDHVPR